MAGDLQDNQGRGEVPSSLPRIHPEGRKFGLAALGLSLVFAWLAWETLAWPMAFLSLGIFAFFRDPERVVPQDDRFIVSPADGRVVQITQVEPPRELTVDDGTGVDGLAPEPVMRVSIFLSLLDVHINRTPIGGVVRRVVYVPGKFLNADLDKASEDNERQHILIERPDGLKVGFTQIAGVIARRIVSFVKPGDTLGVGQRVGMIRFGSRVDIYLPAGTGSYVMVGQRVVAGETVIAAVGSQPLLEGVSQ
ncbi:phosphatidylserine decarboxylase [Qipengyuania huizhouensis]|uniref:phosphatidylserine decarboxylase n=1 Tax=Qipengyuania huizhouensis TaxID=2867245 RepID=UPI001C871E0A|nr:phosphatidylserine decarboxylase [Qipengyuania huizhouensis]MBX7460881.1 phosphatidylserine decarboxylase [Qipengyuania huizhouensis]